MADPKKFQISIALCTYNGEKYLQEQLDSIAIQTRLPDEVVVGDDGSADSTIEIIERWSKSVPFPVYIFKNPQNLGFAQNFSQTMLRCTGDIIFPCDQDDVWKPEKVEIMSRFLIDNPSCSIVFSGRSLIDSSGSPLSEQWEEQYNRTYPLDTSVYYAEYSKRHPQKAGCMMAVRQTLVKNAFPVPAPWPHDVWLFSMAPLYCEIQTLPDVLMLFRRHGNNASALGKEADWANGRDVYYLTSVGQYRAHTPLREDMIKRLSQLPSSSYRDGYLKYLKGQDKHFGNRCKIEDRFWTNLHTLVLEVLSGRYFQHKQPLKCMLFDVKEGILNSFKRTPSEEK